jgi:hypothetical protein
MIKGPLSCTDAGVEQEQAGDEDAIDVVHQRKRQEGGKLHGPVRRTGTTSEHFHHTRHTHRNEGWALYQASGFQKK